MTETNTRQIVQLNNKIILSLEQQLLSAEAAYRADLENSVDDFPGQLRNVLETAQKELASLNKEDSRKYVQTLAENLNSLVDKRVYVNPAECVQNYLENVNDIFEVACAQIKPLLEKRLKDCSAVVPDEHYGQSKSFLQKHSREYKRALKSHNHDEVQDFLIKRYEEHKKCVASVERQRLERSSIDQAPFRLPVLVYEQNGTKFCRSLNRMSSNSDVRLFEVEFKSLEYLFDMASVKKMNIAPYVIEVNTVKSVPQAPAEVSAAPVESLEAVVEAPAEVAETFEHIEYKRTPQNVYHHKKSLPILISAIKGAKDSEIRKKYKVTSETVRKIRENAGVWTARFLKKNYPTLDDIAFKDMPGVVSYSKEPIREQIISNVIEHLKADKIDYLGLEGAHFGSYLWLSDVFKVDAGQSIVVESNPIDFRIMKSVVDHCHVIKPGQTYTRDGKVFKNLCVLQNDLADAVKGFGGYKWNLINLDYTGCINDRKLQTLDALFWNELIADDAVLFMTLNNSPVFQERVLTGKGLNGPKKSNGYGTRDQASVVDACLLKNSQKTSYSVSRICTQEYRSKDADMLLLGYKLVRK